MQVKELSAKLADAESKKAAVEATLALRERQASEVSLPFAISPLPIRFMPCRRREEKLRSWRIVFAMYGLLLNTLLKRRRWSLRNCSRS